MSRRKQIEMSEQEREAFIAASKTIIINSIGPGGYPHPMPMWFAVDPDGTVRMTTFRASQKVKNIQRDPRVSLLVESGEEYAELMGVVLYGKARIVDDIEVVKETLVMCTTRFGAPLDAAAREGMLKVMERTAAKRVCILISPEKIVSWDHRKLGGTY
jgi:PPOX class probable F420-dependent enzyme